MTTPATPRKAGPYVGTGALAQYSFNFPVTTASHLVVVEANADGFETTLTLTTDYMVALNPNQQTSPGGTVTRKAGPLPVFLIEVVKASNRPAAAVESMRNEMAGGLVRLAQALPLLIEHR